MPLNEPSLPATATNETIPGCQNDDLGPMQPPLPTSGTQATIRKRKLDSYLSTGRALYLFAGPKRKSTIGARLRAIGWSVTEIDILQGGAKHDLTKPSVQGKLLAQIDERYWDALFTSPPCDTFSRVKFSNRWGPRPTRTFAAPRGLPNLTAVETRRNRLANSLTDFNYKAMKHHVAHEDTILALEFPEDLGAISTGEWRGTRPASIFQWPAFEELLSLPGVQTGGIRQSDYGTDYIKPTRLIFRFPGTTETPMKLFPGPPEFDNFGFYIGPIPKAEGKVGLAKQSQYEPFRTTSTAAWPSKLCEELVRLTVLSLHASAKRRHIGGHSADDGSTAGGFKLGTVDKMPFDIVEPPKNFWVGGSGPPRSTTSFGRTSEFHDGLGLTSPGRWTRDKRTFPAGQRWDELRLTIRTILRKDLDESGVLKHVSALACGLDIFCKTWIEDIRTALHNWLGKQCGDYDSHLPPEAPTGQPFYTKLIFGLLREARDADYLLFQNLGEGVPLGVIDPLPHCPAIYEPQTKWRLPEDPGLLTGFENANYASAADFTEQIEDQFREEEKLGWMVELSDEEFENRFGKHRAVSALAVLQEKDKIRILHDGTHITHVNHRIRVRDRQRMPTSREMTCLLDEQRSLGKISLAILADASKAHRRVIIQPKERGFLGCRTRPGRVWYNCVGTFGLSSASYWWSRVSGAIFRLVYALLGGEHMFDFLLFADDAEYIANDRGERFSILLAIAVALALGMPFKWAKFRGGFQVSWVGYGIDFKLYAIGLTEARAAWVTGWTDKLVESGFVNVSEFHSGLGRLNYAAQALYYERAFLGLLYLWLGSLIHSSQRRATIPWAIRLVLKWIGRRMADSVAECGRLQVAPHRSQASVEWFRTDAKAEGGRAWIGGWELLGNLAPFESRWFSMEITREEAPWIFAKERDPQWVIAALELLASMVAIALFDPEAKRGGLSECTLTGSTDNRGNTYIVTKLASTKWPITTLLIELSEQLRKRGAILNLTWKKRDDNSEADALTNCDFSKFNPELRIDKRFSDISWIVLDEIMDLSSQLYREVASQRSKGNLPARTYRRQAILKRLKWSDPW